MYADCMPSGRLQSIKPIVRPGAGQTPSSMQPALQYMAGELRVDRGDVLPLLATHNTVRMRFDLEEAEYLNLATPDATFPVQQFSMLADTARNEVSPEFSICCPPCKGMCQMMTALHCLDADSASVCLCQGCAL
jgi:hypothetical protein